ncbi:unnamed protein product [Mytilus edulis]|uniref:Uncharacterized protein n=1 Tax=Mytilus edulis TaxID=6550 RepID=A0A8S3PY51_MYTED|nr:unnamed protein product [Mytilus edulis]
MGLVVSTVKMLRIKLLLYFFQRAAAEDDTATAGISAVRTWPAYRRLPRGTYEADSSRATAGISAVRTWPAYRRLPRGTYEADSSRATAGLYIRNQSIEGYRRSLPRYVRGRLIEGYRGMYVAGPPWATAGLYVRVWSTEGYLGSLLRRRVDRFSDAAGISRTKLTAKQEADGYHSERERVHPRGVYRHGQAHGAQCDHCRQVLRPVPDQGRPFFCIGQSAEHIQGESSREEEETDGRAGGSGVATSREERSRNLEELVVEKSRVEVGSRGLEPGVEISLCGERARLETVKMIRIKYIRGKQCLGKMCLYFCRRGDQLSGRTRECTRRRGRVRARRHRSKSKYERSSKYERWPMLKRMKAECWEWERGLDYII